MPSSQPDRRQFVPCSSFYSTSHDRLVTMKESTETGKHRKPMSSRRSASSKMRARMPRSGPLTAALLRLSFRRPGVATRMSGAWHREQESINGRLTALNRFSNQGGRRLLMVGGVQTPQPGCLAPEPEANSAVGEPTSAVTQHC